MVFSGIHLSVSWTSFLLCWFGSQACSFRSSQKKNSSSLLIFQAEVPRLRLTAQLGSNTSPMVRGCLGQPTGRPCSLSHLTPHPPGTAQLGSSLFLQPTSLPFTQSPCSWCPLPHVLCRQCPYGLSPPHFLQSTHRDFPGGLCTLCPLPHSVSL